jgi:glycerol-3-phosphate dehydrogenase
VTGPDADTRLTAARRSRDLAELAVLRDPVDLLVVGGGITGVGVALDAASRGLSVVLVERGDLAAGTSRWSSKLAHGGVRYLSHGQVGVAWESAVERNRLATVLAPHLVRPMPFLMPMLPSYPTGTRAGVKALYLASDVLRSAARTPSWLPHNRWADAQETRTLVPGLADAKGSYVHVDGALEDDVRLVVAVARTAAGHGARIVTHCEALHVSRDGARVRDGLTGDELDVAARSVVVATGVWSAQVVPDVAMRPSRGSHLLVPAEVLGEPTAAFTIMQPGSRSRFVMGVPRPDGTVLIGLTDDPVDRVDDVPQVSNTDEAFLLETVSSGLRRPLTSGDVIGRYAGLRPLLAGSAADTASADLSRRHALLTRDGVTVIVGGKLTTYRKMAEDAVDAVCRTADVQRRCRTASLPLVGAGRPDLACWGNVPMRLRRRFGTDAAAVAAGGTEPLVTGEVTAAGPALRGEVAWALAAEGAVTADDVAARLRLDLVPGWLAAARPELDAAVGGGVPV